MGEREDKLALYADDLLLFLGDMRESPREAMRIINNFGAISGLKINWAKSSLLLVDPLCAPLPEEVAQIPVVNKFKYLGITISGDPSSYVVDNIVPFLTKLRAKTKIWKNLPISVAWRCNLVKMIWMPELLYVLHNSPIWLYKKWFQKIDSLFRELIWRGGNAQIRLSVLQLQQQEGGVVLPHPISYFFSVSTSACWWM